MVAAYNMTVHRGFSPRCTVILLCLFLYKVCYQLLAVAVQEVEDGNLYHCVATGLLAHCGACRTYEHLSCERGVVYAHIELEQLVLGAARHSFAGEVYSVSHIQQLIYAGYVHYVCLIAHKVGVGLYSCCNLFKVVSLLELNVHHTAVYACTHGDCH